MCPASLAAIGENSIDLRLKIHAGRRVSTRVEQPLTIVERRPFTRGARTFARRVETLLDACPHAVSESLGTRVLCIRPRNFLKEKLHQLPVLYGWRTIYNMNEERRKGQRFGTPLIGVLRNLTRQSGPEEATLKNVAEGGLLLESSQKLGLRDRIEFRCKGCILLGEVVHYGRNKEKWLAGVKFDRRLDDDQLRRILDAGRPQKAALAVESD